MSLTIYTGNPLQISYYQVKEAAEYKATKQFVKRFNKRMISLSNRHEAKPQIDIQTMTNKARVWFVIMSIVQQINQDILSGTCTDQPIPISNKLEIITLITGEINTILNTEANAEANDNSRNHPLTKILYHAMSIYNR